MQQLTLFDEKPSSRIVNVASVEHLSPFRYPGGKTWLVPRILQWLSPQTRQRFHLSPAHPVHFIEPFAGGGIVGLTVAARAIADHVTMVEIDEDVAAVWQTILDNEHWEWLTQQITTFDLTYENVQTFLTRTNFSLRERAFATILKNRVNRGGILAPGAGFIKAGEDGKGIRSRWYPATIAKRIRTIVAMRDRLTFIPGDGMHILRAYADRPDAVPIPLLASVPVLASIVTPS